jgi:hypothetical protein
MQDGSVASTANYFIDVLNKMLEGRLIRYKLWPSRFPVINIRYCCPGRNLIK